MSITQTIETDLGKVAHAFVVGAAKLKSVITGAEAELAKAQPAITQAESIANAVVNEIYPGADAVVQAIEAAMAKVFTAVDAAGDAATANGLNISLDTATVDAIKTALPVVKAQAATTPGS